MLRKKKCAWSNQYSEELIEIELKSQKYYVLPEYENELEKHLKKLNKNSLKFIWLMLGFVFFGSIVSVFSEPYQSISMNSILFGLGLILIFMPYTTPQTSQMMGFKKSIKLAKISGYILSLIGFLLFFKN